MASCRRYAGQIHRQFCSPSPSAGFEISETDALRGAYCPLVVPFSDGKIDFDSYGKLIERQISEGTHGLLVNATSGEPTMLSVEERGQLAEFAIKTSRGRLPVCAATASELFEATAALIDRFDEAGADLILVVTPFYSAPPQRGGLLLHQAGRPHEKALFDLSHSRAHRLHSDNRYAGRD